jgi:hypothetical protein
MVFLRPLQYRREREDHEKPSEKQQIRFLLLQLTLLLIAVMLELTIASPAVTNNQNSAAPQAAIVEFARVRIIFSWMSYLLVVFSFALIYNSLRAHARTHARTHACTHARTHARTHAYGLGSPLAAMPVWTGVALQ